MQRLIICAVCTFAALATLTANGAVTGSLKLENDDVLKGAIRWSSREKAYVVTTHLNLRSSSAPLTTQRRYSLKRS